MVRAFAFLLCAVGVVASSRAEAQDAARWGIVIVTVADDPADVAPAADRVYAQLSVSGRTLVDDATFARSVDGVLSAPPHDAPHAVVVRLSEGVNEVAREVAAGRSGIALDKARAILTDVEANLAALGRDESSEENLRNLCLFAVRAHLDAHHRDEAAAQALECVRMSPDFTEPSPHWHPPEVVAAFRAARATLDAPGHATLLVQTAPGDPAHCTVRDAGRPIGQAPARVAVAPGVHQFQVECQENRPARVHRVIVQAGREAHVVVPARFDEVLRTTPRLALVYADRDAMGTHLAEDIARIGRAATLAHAVVVRDDDGRLFLRHFLVPREGPARSAGSSLVERPSDGDTLRSAVDAVTSGLAEEADTGDLTPPDTQGHGHDDNHDASGGHRDDGGGGGHAAPYPQPPGDHPPTALGAILGTTGLVGLVGGAAFFTWLKLAEHDLSATGPMEAGFLPAQEHMDTAMVATVVSSLVGGVALTTALPWLLPDEDGVPWWGWVSGGLGAVSAAAAVVFAAIGPGDAPLGASDRHAQNGATVALLASLAVPLLTVPLVYALRPHRAPSVAVTASLGGLAVSGTW